MKDFDKNDVGFGRKTFVMTFMSLWITLWKLGISLLFLEFMSPVRSENMWKSRYTDFSLRTTKTF